MNPCRRLSQNVSDAPKRELKFQKVMINIYHLKKNHQKSSILMINVLCFDIFGYPILRHQKSKVVRLDNSGLPCTFWASSISIFSHSSQRKVRRVATCAGNFWGIFEQIYEKSMRNLWEIYEKSMSNLSHRPTKVAIDLPWQLSKYKRF